MSKRIVCGYEIDVDKRFMQPTTIRIHKLGAHETSWLTPHELDTFIAELEATRDELKEAT